MEADVMKRPTFKRSKSIGNISDMQKKFQQFEDFLFELPSKIESITQVPKKLMEKRNEMITKNLIAKNKMESGDYPKAPIQPKALAILLLPFLPIFIYFFYVFSASIILFVYMMGIMVYFLCLLSYVIAELAIRPPWYKPSRKKLTTEQLPAYWQGIWHNPKFDLGLDYEDIEFETNYGMKLRGWFVAAPKNVTAHNIGICFIHGGGRDRRAFLRHVPLFHNQGYDCMLFDFSEHGMSDGTSRGFSYGIREKDDVRFAVKWLKEVRQLKRVVVVGTSVGASSAIMAAAEDPSIDAVVAENPVACAEDFALFHLKRMLAIYAPNTYNSFFLKPFYFLVARIFLLRIGAPFGYDRPYQVVHKIGPRPILLMHGTNDDLVPYDHSQRLFDAAKENKELWLVEGAWHCALFDLNPEEYGKRIHAFLANYMKEDMVDQKPLHSSDQIDVVEDAERRPLRASTGSAYTYVQVEGKEKAIASDKVPRRATTGQEEIPSPSVIEEELSSTVEKEVVVDEKEKGATTHHTTSEESAEDDGEFKDLPND